LGGGVSALFPLDVSRVEVLVNDEAIQVSYFNNDGADVDLVAQVTVALTGVTLKPGGYIALQGEYAPGHQRTTVGHMAGGEPERILAPVLRGQLNLDSGGSPGQTTRGSFNMLFETGDGFGAGRDLYGTFSQVALDAGFDPTLPDAGS
jgi:hypothetical protein